MSDTVGIIAIIGGLLVSAVGLYYLARTRRQVLGLVIMVVGFTAAGVGLLTLESTEVRERTPVTVSPESPPATATPASTQ